ncbi:MAG: fused MFS/spermidine synthase [Planctomycetota bacterium]|nr:fused MFS/spermidine synthase [Planctomycetota bacterium]
MVPLVPRLAVFALGFSAVVTQLVLMRELLSAFSGNEIGLGILLGVWLLLMGLGSWAGRTATRLKAPSGLLAGALVILALWPLIAVFLVRMLRNAVLVRGVEAGVVETTLGCLALLFPYCVVSGYLLTLACTARLSPSREREGAGAPLADARGSECEPLGVGTVYVLDSVGSIAGGILFTFVLLQFFSPFGALAFPAFLNLFLAAALGVTGRQRALVSASVAAALALAVVLAAWNPEQLTTARQYSQGQVVFAGYSPYAKIVVTEAAGQFDFYENGVPYFSTQNVEEVEGKVHYAMAQRPNARRVLLLSGGVSGTAKEILKYGVERVDYVELDPLIVAAGRTYTAENLQDSRINVIVADARVFVRETRERYDVVLVDLPEPSTSQLNRFYTREFYSAVNGILAPDGVLGFAAGEYTDYVSPELAQVLGTINATLKQVFANVLLIPADKVAFLASQGALHQDIGKRIEESGVQTKLIKPSYLRFIMTPDRLADMERATAQPASINEDFNPVLYYAQLRQWLGKFQFSVGVFEVVLLALLAAYLWRIRAVPFAIFSAGFAASGLEVVILMGFQIAFGSVYHRVGLIVTAFMAGLALGAAAAKRLPGHARRNVIALAGVIAVFAWLLPWLLRALSYVGTGMALMLAEGAFAGLAFVLAAIVGLQFALAGRDESATGVTASSLYTADFIGACLGALLVSALLIPLLGVTAACVLTGVMNLLGGVVVFYRGGVKAA